jgi:hypothetical protein
MGRYKLLFFAGVSLSMATISLNTSAETSRADSPPKTIKEQTTPEQSARQLQALILPLIHYPDHMVSAGFAASSNPAQIVLAARYLNEPASVTGNPDFDQATLTLMQYPALLSYMAANLDWVSELGRALAIHEPELLWTALADERFAPTAAGEPIRVARTTRYVVQPSRPTYTSSRHLTPSYHEVVHYPDRRIKRYRVKHRHVAPLRHQRIWRDSGFYDLHSRRHGLHHPSNHRFHRPSHHPDRRLNHWRLGLSLGHQPRHSSYHRGFNDDWLLTHQRALERRIHRKQHAYSHREQRRNHRQENRREGKWDRHNDHKQERQHRREHRQENRHEYGQERRQERREHDASHRRSTPKRERPREWMFAQGQLK